MIGVNEESRRKKSPMHSLSVVRMTVSLLKSYQVPLRPPLRNGEIDLKNSFLKGKSLLHKKKLKL